jgi:hypothetical protein
MLGRGRKCALPTVPERQVVRGEGVVTTVTAPRQVIGKALTSLSRRTPIDFRILEVAARIFDLAGETASAPAAETDSGQRDAFAVEPSPEARPPACCA